MKKSDGNDMMKVDAKKNIRGTGWDANAWQIHGTPFSVGLV